MNAIAKFGRKALLTAAIPLATFAQHSQALDILITNDDGYDTYYIQALYGTLRAHGHTVTISAPKGNQSGKSSSFTFFTPTAVGTAEGDPNVHYVDSTPVMSVMYGLDVVLDEAPDLVISGPNEGHNLGDMTNHSGTVGAAMKALNRGVPSIAVSADRDPRTSPPQEVAAFVADIVSELESNQYNDRLLPEGMALNVNIPTLRDGEGNSLVNGIKYTNVASYSGLNPEFVSLMGPYISRVPASYFANEQDPTGEYTKAYVGSKSGVVFNSASALKEAETDRRSEGLWLEDGYITISTMNGSYGSYGSWYARLLLRGLDK